MFDLPSLMSKWGRRKKRTGTSFPASMLGTHKKEEEKNLAVSIAAIQTGLLSGFHVDKGRTNS